MAVQKQPMTDFLNKHSKFLVISGLLVSAMAVLLMLMTRTNSLVIIGGIFLLSLLVMFFLRPDRATILVMFIIYTNINVLAYQFHGLPLFIAGTAWLLLGIPFLVYVFISPGGVVIDYPFLLMILFGGSLLVSLCVSVDREIALGWIYTYLLEGVALYFLLINVIRRYDILKGVIWTVLFAGALLGSLTLIQDLTKDYENDFWGLAQRDLRFGADEAPGSPEEALFRSREKLRLAHRAFGNVGDPNHFARVLIVLLPLGIFRFFDEKKAGLKVLAMSFTILTLIGVLLTYSRGAFLAVCVMTMIMTFLRYISLKQVLIGILGGFLLIVVASPGYLSRIDTIKGIEGLFSQKKSADADEVILNRTTEMIAAFNVFVDYPFVGVGPAQFIKFYSLEYMNDPAIAYKRFKINRAAHSFHAEMAAELGLLGLLTFHAIVGYILLRLWKVRKRWRYQRPDYANTATAFMLAIVGYFGTSFFLSFVFQRYYWVLLAIAGAALQIFDAAALADAKPNSEIKALPAPGQTSQTINS